MDAGFRDPGQGPACSGVLLVPMEVSGWPLVGSPRGGGGVSESRVSGSFSPVLLPAWGVGDVVAVPEVSISLWFLFVP